MRAPSKTVKVGTLGGAVAVVIVWVIVSVWPTVEVPANVGTAIGVIVTAAAAWIVRDPARRPDDDDPPKH